MDVHPQQNRLTGTVGEFLQRLINSKRGQKFNCLLVPMKSSNATEVDPVVYLSKNVSSFKRLK